MYSKPAPNLKSLSRVWRTLAFRLTAGYALAGLLLVILATASLYFLLVSELEKSTELFLGDKLHVLRTMLRERPEDTEALEEEVELETAARRYEHFYIRLLDEHSKPLMTTPGMADELDLSQLARRTQGRLDVPLPMRGRHGQALRVATALAQAGAPPGHTITIQIAIDVSQQEAFLARFRLGSWIILLASLTIFPIVGYQIARQGIRPVEEMAATARRISSTHLGERIRTEGYPFELASLAGTFNQMLDRLEDSFDRISKFSADIAHDLRTPVNNIRGEAEVALVRARTIDEYRDALESSLEEAVRLSDLIGNLLFLARTESPLMHLRRESLDVTELLTGVREYYEASAADAGVSLTTDFGDGPVMAELDRTLMQRAVGNLVSNAIAHTSSGGSVVMASHFQGAVVRIEVADTGIGIPPEALPRVFDRFFRVDPSRSQASGGTGLGLAIVQGIMVLHDGKVEIASEPGKGTQVILSLPAVASTAAKAGIETGEVAHHAEA
jgi:two-component system, OmpR family, heavy metal sensor histidine kinase CusS